MSLDTGSSFSDDANPNIEHGPLLFTSIPWRISGEGVLTVKLSLWCLHMLTGNDVSIQDSYPPLETMCRMSVALPDTEALPSNPAQDEGAAKSQNKAAGKKKRKE